MDDPTIIDYLIEHGANPYVVHSGFPAFKKPDWEALDHTSQIKFHGERKFAMKEAPEVTWNPGEIKNLFIKFVYSDGITGCPYPPTL